LLGKGDVQHAMLQKTLFRLSHFFQDNLMNFTLISLF